MAWAEGVQYGQIDLLAGAPQRIDKRSGIQFAIKRQKQCHGMGHQYGWPGHHAGGGLLGKKGLLFGG